MNNGWVKLRRDTLENPIICKDNDHMAVWIYLLLNATHKEILAIFGGKKITLAKGQLLTSRSKISKALKIEDTKVKRILKLFKSEQLIAQQTDMHKSLVTIEGWGDWDNENAQHCDQEMPNKCPTEQETENEKEKSSKREKEKEKEKYKNVRIYRGTPTYEKRGNGQPKIESTFDADEFFQAALERSNRKMMERRNKAAQG